MVGMVVDATGCGKSRPKKSYKETKGMVESTLEEKSIIEDDISDESVLETDAVETDFDEIDFDNLTVGDIRRMMKNQGYDEDDDFDEDDDDVELDYDRESSSFPAEVLEAVSDMMVFCVKSIKNREIKAETVFRVKIDAYIESLQYGTPGMHDIADLRVALDDVMNHKRYKMIRRRLIDDHIDLLVFRLGDYTIGRANKYAYRMDMTGFPGTDPLEKLRFYLNKQMEIFGYR